MKNQWFIYIYSGNLMAQLIVSMGITTIVNKLKMSYLMGDEMHTHGMIIYVTDVHYLQNTC
jgi:hypothetical protein